jgi:flagellin-like protein
VSPIIATILLVAITVVLAAVLYVLISGLTTGPGNAPLGSHFGWGAPQNTTTGTSPLNYTVEIASASGVSLSEITLGLRSATGGSLALATYVTTMSLFSAQGQKLASYSTASGAATAIGSFNGVLSAGMTIVISATATSPSHGLLGMTLVAIGGGSYSGTVPSSAFP